MLVESNSNVVPAVEIDECGSVESVLDSSSTSSSLLAALRSHRRHSAPNIPESSTLPLREHSVRAFIFIPVMIYNDYL